MNGGGSGRGGETRQLHAPPCNQGQQLGALPGQLSWRASSIATLKIHSQAHLSVQRQAGGPVCRAGRPGLVALSRWLQLGLHMEGQGEYLLGFIIQVGSLSRARSSSTVTLRLSKVRQAARNQTSSAHLDVRQHKEALDQRLHLGCRGRQHLRSGRGGAGQGRRFRPLGLATCGGDWKGAMRSSWDVCYALSLLLHRW